MQIGYLDQEGEDFSVTTSNVDPEISTIAGPQLVVPIMNARFSLNAANARWGSLYDALYGTDAIDHENEGPESEGYNPKRGEKVIRWSREFLDKSAPLALGTHADITYFRIDNGQLVIGMPSRQTELMNPDQFAGYSGDPSNPDVVLLVKNQLHIEIVIDRHHPIGSTDPAGIADVVLESATTTIMDCEDSIAAVDAADKVTVYRNWLGLMRGDLVKEIEKNGRTILRKLNDDRIYVAPNGEPMKLPGRSLMLVRNVGHLMTNPAILDSEGREVPEGIMDCVITGLIALWDIGKNGCHKNSPAGSMYIVKPKMHGTQEVAFADELFGRTEQLLGMDANDNKDGHHG